MGKDYFKRATMMDYTTWDLNAPCVHHHNRRAIVKMFHRKARRTLKKNLQKMQKGA